MQNTKNIAHRVFKNYCESYNKIDMEGVLSLFSDNCAMWGTGIDEERIGKKCIERSTSKRLEAV